MAEGVPACGKLRFQIRPAHAGLEGCHVVGLIQRPQLTQVRKIKRHRRRAVR